MNIFISTGEASGDMHAANLIKKVHQINPNIVFSGMGSSAMRAAGANIIIDSTNLAVIGGVEILYHIPKIYRALRTIKKSLIKNRPDLLILVDYAGFNLRLAKIAKKLGIKTLYYISPKIWAWHQSRIKMIRKYIDMMAVIFPFEVKFYTDAKVPVTLVRHPLLDTVKSEMDKQTAQNIFGIDPQKTTVGLFPGSRSNEIKYLLPVMMETALLLQNKYPHSQFLLPLAPSLSEEHIKTILAQYPVNVLLIKNQTYDVANVCDAIIATSGTVTLEIALLGIPMVIVYKLTNLTYWIVKQIIKIPYIGLCNIVAEKKIVPELIHHEANAKNIATEIEKILDDTQYRETMHTELRHMKEQFTLNSGTRNIEDVVVEFLGLPL